MEVFSADLTTREVARALDLDIKQVQVLCRSGVLPATFVRVRPRGWRISSAALEALRHGQGAMLSVPEGPGTLSTTEAAARMHLTKDAVSELCRRGVLPACKQVRVPWTAGPGRELGTMTFTWRVTPEDLDAYMAARTAAAQERGACPARGGRPLTPFTADMVARRAGYAAPTAADKKAGYPWLRRVCAYYALDRATLEGPINDALVVEARRLAVYLCATQGGLGPTAIGRLLRREHATIIHHLQRMRERPTRDEHAALADILAEGAGATRREEEAS